MKNWAGNHEYRAARIHHPETVEEVQELVRRLPKVRALGSRPFEPRPHWGKLFTLAPDEVRARYEKRPDFVALVRRHDPAGKFRNDFLDRYVFGDARAAGPTASAAVRGTSS